MYDNGRFLLPLGIVMDKKIQEINYYTNNIKLITMVNFSLEGKVALVTGASYGMGDKNIDVSGMGDKDAPR